MNILQSKRRRTIVFLIVLWLFALSVYLANGRRILTAYDATPNSLIVLNFLEHHTLHLDRFLNAEAYRGFNYFFVKAPNNHGSSLYPIGPAIVSAPIYVLFYLYLKIVYWGNLIPLGDLAFEPTRYLLEKIAAAILTATSVVIFFQVARSRFNARIALIVTFIFAFATSTWTVSSQGLWQHGPMNLVIISITFAFLQAQRCSTAKSKAAWLMMAGLGCGLLPGIRPTSLLFVGVAMLWSGCYFRGKTVFLILGAILAALPAALWNWYYFNDAIMGGYKTLQYIYDLNIFPQALAALVISPSRGILIYTPVVLFAFAGCWSLLSNPKLSNPKLSNLKRQPIDLWILGLFIAGFGMIANYACTKTWYAGSVYGPRFLTDVMPATALMMAYWLQSFAGQAPGKMVWWRRSWRSAAIGITFILSAALSTSVQFIGAAVGYDGYGHWHDTPIPIENGVPVLHQRAAKRFWDWDDLQIMRGIQSVRYRQERDRSTQLSYLQSLSGQILQVYDQRNPGEPTLQAAPEALIEGRVIIKNLGSEAWYGYKSGMFVGEVLVQGVMRDSGLRVIMPIEFSLADQIVPAGQSGKAVGVMLAPTLPGKYYLTLKIGVRGVGFTDSTQVEELTVPLIVRPPLSAK
jgi:hypothetical protein